MRFSALSYFSVLLYALLACAQSSLLLGYLPLAVKSPFLHGWIISRDGNSPADAWPNFYTTNREFGWAGLIRVDGQTYQWIGRNFNATRTIISEITPTRSIFRLEAGPVRFNVTFLSPIEPTDYVRQSVPFTYVYIDAITPNDTASHSIQVYSDISAQWVTRSDMEQVQWSTTTQPGMVYHELRRRTPSSMLDNGGIAEDSTGYYAMASRSGLTWQAAADVDCRNRFSTQGSLANSSDTSFRAVNQAWPVFAISIDLGNITASSPQPDPIVWALGLVRDPVLTYSTESGVQTRTSYFWSRFSRIDEVITAFLSDFSDARGRNEALDQRILTAALRVSTEYADILSLVTRQIFAAMDITVPVEEPGRTDGSDVKIFLKDIGTTTQRVNPVEVIYGALPAFLYFNPQIVGHLLMPLLEFQSTSRYRNPYAAPDLGSTYPVVLGNTSDTRFLAVESCADMLITAYTHAVKSGDGSIISRYRSLLQPWADFLVENTLHTNGFVTADGLRAQDMSNLAFKGILGIYSFAKIDEATRSENARNATYMERVTELMGDWRQFAVSGNHIQSIYGQSSSWGLMYNLFPAIWLDTGLVDEELLTRQAAFYNQQQGGEFGLPLDSSNTNIAFPHWTMMTAATIPNALASTVRNRLINMAHRSAFQLSSRFPMPMRQQVSDGAAVPDFASGSAIHGASYALLAMELENRPITNTGQNVSDSNDGSSGGGSNVGAIVGGVVGGLVFLGLLVFGGILLWKRKQKSKEDAAYEYSKTHPFPGHTDTTIPVPFHMSESTSNIALPPSSAVKSQNSSNQQNVGVGVVDQSATRTDNQSQLQWRSEWDGLSQDQRSNQFSPPTSPSTNSVPSLPPGAAAAVPVTSPVMSSKYREARGLPPITQSIPHHSSAPSMSAVSTLSNPYSSTAGNASQGRTEDLRAEVEQLRREMETIRVMAEPPPGYS